MRGSRVSQFSIGECVCEVLRESVGLHVDKLAALFSCGEYHYTVYQCEKSVVLTHAYIQAGMVLCASLAFEDIAGFAFRAAEDLHTKSFAF